MDETRDHVRLAPYDRDTIPTDMAGNTAGTFTIATTGITRMRGGNRRGTVIGLLNSVANRMSFKPLEQGRLTSQAGGAG